MSSAASLWNHKHQDCSSLHFSRFSLWPAKDLIHAGIRLQSSSLCTLWRNMHASQSHSRKRLMALVMLRMQALCDMGFSAIDIITTLFRIVRNFNMHEFLKLEYIRVGYRMHLLLLPPSGSGPAEGLATCFMACFAMSGLMLLSCRFVQSRNIMHTGTHWHISHGGMKSGVNAFSFRHWQFCALHSLCRADRPRLAFVCHWYEERSALARQDPLSPCCVTIFCGL